MLFVVVSNICFLSWTSLLEMVLRKLSFVILDTKFKCYEWPLRTWSFGSSLASLSDGCLAYLSSSIWCSNICNDICCLMLLHFPWETNLKSTEMFVLVDFLHFTVNGWWEINPCIQLKTRLSVCFGIHHNPCSQSLLPAFVRKPNQRICLSEKKKN